MKKGIAAILLVALTITANAQALIRGPYLMVGTPNSIVLRWRTDLPTSSKVQYGSAANALTLNVTDNTLVTEHIVKLSGLSSKTRYFYSIGSTATVYQGDANNYFETMPVAGESGKYRFGVYGDCGTNSALQANTRDRMNAYLGNNYMNAWLLLGDNAYSFGTEPEYQSNFFNHYKDTFMKKTPLFPTPGNHDYNNDNFARQNDHNVPYYDVFSMPSQGESGGLASGTKCYYSYDYGNVHFLALDSYGREDQATRLYDTLGRQVQWIKADLAANQNKQWIVAYWHHPPFSQGSRNSETDPEMTAVRQNFIRILERYGVDLIICGHSHIYERSRLMGGFYEPQAAFSPSIHNYSSSSGKYDGSTNSCPYVKNPNNKRGTVYVVSGSAGHLGGLSPDYPHKAMYYSNNTLGGAMLLEVEGNRLDAKWIGEDGEIRDKFTMEKNVNITQTQNIDFNSSITLTSSFLSTYNWSNGETGRSISVSPAVSTEYRVKDEFNCIEDVFKVTVGPALPVKLISFTGAVDASNQVTLKWSSAYEVNSGHFVIERSIDGKDYQEVGKVFAAKNSSQNKNYEFKDETSSNISNRDSLYYRLKMVDLDGKVEYSRIVSLKIQRIDKSLDIEIIPNPGTSQTVQLRIVGKEQTDAKMTITNQAGKILKDKQLILSTKLMTFLPENLPPGIYFVKVIIESTSIIKKVLVF